MTQPLIRADVTVLPAHVGQAGGPKPIDAGAAEARRRFAANVAAAEADRVMAWAVR